MERELNDGERAIVAMKKQIKDLIAEVNTCGKVISKMKSKVLQKGKSKKINKHSR